MLAIKNLSAGYGPIEVVRAIEQLGSPSAALLLRLRAVLGADEPEVLGLLALLTTAPFWQLFGTARFDWFPGIGYYPKSLLGTDVERVSNAYPPTVCFLLGGIWTIGAVMLMVDVKRLRP